MSLGGTKLIPQRQAGAYKAYTDHNHHTMENNVLNNIVKILAILLIGLSTKVSAGEVLVFGRAVHIESALLRETRDYHVYLPASYGNTDNAFPVIYQLDGDVHRLKAFSGVLEGLSTETLGNQVLQAIVVAIPIPIALETYRQRSYRNGNLRNESQTVLSNLVVQIFSRRFCKMNFFRQ